MLIIDCFSAQASLFFAILQPTKILAFQQCFKMWFNLLMLKNTVVYQMARNSIYTKHMHKLLLAVTLH